MTENELKKLIGSMPNQTWKSYFSDEEWMKIVNNLYEEYKKYSSMDIGFEMYYKAGIIKLLSSDGPEILRQRFL